MYNKVSITEQDLTFVDCDHFRESLRESLITFAFSTIISFNFQQDIILWGKVISSTKTVFLLF